MIFPSLSYVSKGTGRWWWGRIGSGSISTWVSVQVTADVFPGELHGMDLVRCESGREIG